MQTRTRWQYAAGLLAAIGALCWQVPAQATVTYSGEAQVVAIDLLPPLVDVNLVKVTLPSTGGQFSDTLLTVNVPGSLSNGLVTLGAAAAQASTTGSGNEASSQATVANVGLGVNVPLVLNLAIGSTTLQANSMAVCVGGAPQLSGSSVVENLVINGEAIVVTGAPNQTINVLGLVKVVINEQVSTSDSITVNALHVSTTGLLAGILDVVISRAHSDIGNCPPLEPVCPDPNNPECPLVCPGDIRCPCPNPLRSDCPLCPVKDFVTGGGYVLRNGAKVSFSTHGGRNGDGSLRNGHLNVVDHGPSGPHIKSTGFFDYTGADLTRVLSFNCTGASGSSCQVTVTDNGEPGNAQAGGTDRWFLKSPIEKPTCSGAYCAGSTSTSIAGGNIQLHKVKGCQAVSYDVTPTPPPPPPPPPKPCKGKKCG